VKAPLIVSAMSPARFLSANQAVTLFSVVPLYRVLFIFRVEVCPLLFFYVEDQYRAPSPFVLWSEAGALLLVA